MEKQIKEIVDSGAKVVVSGGKIGDLALHYLNKHGLMAVRLTSKWDVRRLCRAVNATPLPKLTPPTAEELGYADLGKNILLNTCFLGGIKNYRNFYMQVCLGNLS